MMDLEQMSPDQYRRFCKTRYEHPEIDNDTLALLMNDVSDDVDLDDLENI